MSLEGLIGLGLVLFAIGAVGFFIRKDAIILLLCVEIMLNAVNIILAAFSRYLYGAEGQVFIFIIMTVAAAEAAVGLAVIVVIYRLFGTLDMSRINHLKG